ncbi:MAG TPA: DUF3137 domain-containing protein [Acholeplasmataceae bacterium]|nr:DUF3137 domain-containing protein [Acholeplasmataceae bacterium]
MNNQEEILYSKFESLNKMRRKVLRRLVISYLVLFFLGIISLSVVSKNDFDFDSLNVLWGIIIVIGIFTHRLILKNYRKRFKAEIVPIAIEQFGKDITYTPEGISSHYAKITDMFGYFTSFKSEDTVFGKIEDVDFKCADVKVGFYRGSGKNRRYVKVCHGQFYIFDFNKRFRTSTVIREKSLRRPSGLEKIELESVDFNNTFKIYTSNPHDAFYILTPHFMEKLILLERNHPGDLYIAFYNNQLFIGINNDKDRFEPPILSDINPTTIQSQLDDLYIIKDIIIELKLNNKIFIY